MELFSNNQERVILEVKTSRTEEETPEAMVQFLTSLTGLKTRFFFFWRRGVPISLEIAVINQSIRFFISVPQRYQAFIESQLISQYPKALIVKSKDYVPVILNSFQDLQEMPKLRHNALALGQLKLSSGFLYPLKTFKDFKEVDPLSSLLGVLSKAKPNEQVCIQFLLVPTNSSWQSKGQSVVLDKPKDSAGVTITNPYTKVIAEKISYSGFKTAIRIAVNSESKDQSKQFLYEIANSFASFNNPSGNSFFMRRPLLWQKTRFINALSKRSKYFMPMRQILNVMEIGTLFHFPTDKLSKIHNISWHKTILSEPPEALPVAEGLNDGDKQEINFFAKAEYKNKMTNFGIKQKDRRKHVYVIGKTGTGKSTLIANMAISDMRNKKGFCVIDPHGDLSEIILDYVPSFRVNDVVYLDPSDANFAFALNPLEVQNPYQKELVVSGIVAIFHKLYAHTWGPRLEYILRNALLSVIDLPDATMLMIPEILTNNAFRAKAIEKLNDNVLKSYWLNEFEQMPARLKSEALSPILNKVGQFISSHTIRNIIKNPKSSIDLQKIMDEGKILLLNLSQGRLGEDNAALLGAMIITKLQLAAMNRVNQQEEERKDFYLYVDEFQNFATTSFIKILSEARKYRLNLILANQYIAQIPEDVRAAIFGNAGTMLSFLIGAQDTSYMAKEFGERFKEEDLLALGNYQAIIKLAIEGVTQPPFLCYTLPLPKSVTQNREKVIRSSRERYMKAVK
ncbi:DUF87 domain-containing protein [Candidatus Microgenomates bacterium]|nr:MAG: DUF87 domain-containing protein [Candidatus Microgenomates bacterium]